jgi:hypothetical protein
MAIQGQLNQIVNEIKDALEDGIESTGVICTDGTPAYGGTGTGEDLAGFMVLAHDIDDEQEESEFYDLPLVRFWTEVTPVDYFLDASAAYAAELNFEIFISEHHTKTIDSTEHSRKMLVNWYLERLEYILITLEFTAIKEMGVRNTRVMNMGRVTLEDEFVYAGSTTLEVQYLREVS